MKLFIDVPNKSNSFNTVFILILHANSVKLYFMYFFVPLAGLYHGLLDRLTDPML